MGDERYPKARVQGKRSKGPSRLGKKRYRILKERGIEWNRVRVTAGDHDRWKDFCKQCTFTARTGWLSGGSGDEE